MENIKEIIEFNPLLPQHLDVILINKVENKGQT